MRVVSGMAETRFREIRDHLRHTVHGTKAIILIGLDGVMLDHLALDRHFDIEGFAAEYAMLLRIALRSCQDTGAGALTEHIVVSEKSFTVARCAGTNFCIILVSDALDQLGRARYELKRAAQRLQA
jgi:predicted regulator of Ras-like GTPase activity (Roadblock/LC7/MglB family)